MLRRPHGRGSQKGRQSPPWVEGNLPDDAPQWGPHGTAIEANYVWDILDGIRGNGLTLEK